MKKAIHPEYSSDAKVICACGHKFTTGSTVKELRTEVCSNCHPFYTGKQNLIDTAGRVDRFQRLVAKKTDEGSATRGRRAKLKAKQGRRVAKATKE